MSDFLDHAFYAAFRPGDCLCNMCMRAKPCTTCKKPSRFPIKARTKKGYKPYCFKHGVEEATKMKVAELRKRQKALRALEKRLTAKGK